MKAEQEKLVKLREDQIKQEKEREEIRRLEFERLHQIQEEQRRLEFERKRQEESIRMEQLRLEEERRRQERIQAEKNALYNRQRLDMEAKNFASGANAASEEQRRLLRSTSEREAIAEAAMTPEERIIKERLEQQDKLREEHKKEEAQIRQEKLNLIQQEEMLIARQEDMLRQIEAERINLAKQEDLIRSRQTGRLQQVRQEKQLLEKQEEMLMMREQQLMQERIRQEKLREEQKTLREQEEAIRKRQQEISKELMMGDLSDTGSESITVCPPMEGQVFLGPKVFAPAPSQVMAPPPPKPLMYTDETNNAMATDEDTLDENGGSGEEDEEEEDEDYYESKVEVKQQSTSVPTSVRTIETKIDNPPWAPVTPYLSFPERQNQVRNSQRKLKVKKAYLVILFHFQEEVRAILSNGYTKAGVVTSPESVRTSTNMITTPESSLQSQTSQHDAEGRSISSSCAGSPPPVPPLPLDGKRDSFQPVQPDIPPR